MFNTCRGPELLQSFLFEEDLAVLQNDNITNPICRVESTTTATTTTAAIARATEDDVGGAWEPSGVSSGSYADNATIEHFMIKRQRRDALQNEIGQRYRPSVAFSMRKRERQRGGQTDWEEKGAFTGPRRNTMAVVVSLMGKAFSFSPLRFLFIVSK